MKKLIYLIALLLIIAAPTLSNDFYWNEITGSDIAPPGEKRANPIVYRTYELNLAPFKMMLWTAPHEDNIKLRNSSFIISVPMPDGNMQKFRIVEYRMIEEPLVQKYPGIKTFYGDGIDNPQASIRLDITQKGFHAMIFTGTEKGIAVIDPITVETAQYYTVYYRKDCLRQQGFDCYFTEQSENTKPINNVFDSQGDNLRSYRLALACTGEYAARFGSTTQNVHNEMITAMNRINGVYEKDVSCRMVIIANNDLLIYLNGATDPFSNNNGSAMLQENINNTNTVIGIANYDVGHVFSTGGGGIAYLGVICGTNKAGGVTGLPNPIGDPFYIDYVAHEMGHQFGGNHTFNSQQGGCGGGNRAPSAAYEPGSASTIMGYAGLCGGDDLQNNSDAYFHIHSIIEIRNHVENGTGNNCPVVTSTGNGDPTVTVPAGGFYIPKSTPFSLTGSATDPNSDPMFYCWEQYNLGPAGTWNNPTGNAPIFRSFTPVASGTRIFPKLTSLLNNTVNVGELLPTYDRLLTFRLTARDNKPGGGGLSNDVVVFSVDGTSGPFLVTFPNTNVTIGGDQTITWDVAGTTASPVSCADVKISLSTDGGNTWPTVLAASTPNDGSQLVTLPLIDNTTARIKIEAVGNIFFDISNVNFTLTSTIGIQNLSGTPVQFALEQNYPNPFNPMTMISYGIPKKSSVTMEIYDVTGRLVSTPIQNLVQTEGNYRLEFDGTNLPSGVYYYRITAGEFKNVKKMILVK